MDIGEKFEKLHLERVTNEDPNSVPFYNALRQQERKLGKGMRKANSKMGKFGGANSMAGNNHKSLASGASTTFQV
jgi:hypothetical protein